MINERTYAFSETLRQLMKKHPLTQKRTTQRELADYVEIRPQTVSQYCTGETQPSAEKLLKIADYFGVTADYLLVGCTDEVRADALHRALRQQVSEKLAGIADALTAAEKEVRLLLTEEPEKVVNEKKEGLL